MPFSPLCGAASAELEFDDLNVEGQPPGVMLKDVVLGIDSDPERFAQPGPERTRLEGALAQEGEDLTTDGSADITDQTS